MHLTGENKGDVVDYFIPYDRVQPYKFNNLTAREEVSHIDETLKITANIAGIRSI